MLLTHLSSLGLAFDLNNVQTSEIKAVLEKFYSTPASSEIMTSESENSNTLNQALWNFITHQNNLEQVTQILNTTTLDENLGEKSWLFLRLAFTLSSEIREKISNRIPTQNPNNDTLNEKINNLTNQESLEPANAWVKLLTHLKQSPNIREAHSKEACAVFNWALLQIIKKTSMAHPFKDKIVNHASSLEIFDERTWALLHVFFSENPSEKTDILNQLQTALRKETGLREKLKRPDKTTRPGSRDSLSIHSIPTDLVDAACMQARLFLLSQPDFTLHKKMESVEKQNEEANSEMHKGQSKKEQPTQEKVEETIISPILASDDLWAWLGLLSNPQFNIEAYEHENIKSKIFDALEQSTTPYFLETASKRKEKKSTTFLYFVKLAGLKSQEKTALFCNLFSLLAANSGKQYSPEILKTFVLIRTESDLEKLNKTAPALIITEPGSIESEETVFSFFQKIATQYIDSWDETILDEKQQEQVAIAKNQEKQKQAFHTENALNIQTAFISLIQIPGISTHLLASKATKDVLSTKMNQILPLISVRFSAMVFALLQSFDREFVRWFFDLEAIRGLSFLETSSPGAPSSYAKDILNGMFKNYGKHFLFVITHFFALNKNLAPNYPLFRAMTQLDNYEISANGVLKESIDLNSYIATDTDITKAENEAKQIMTQIIKTNLLEDPDFNLEVYFDRASAAFLNLDFPQIKAIKHIRSYTGVLDQNAFNKDNDQKKIYDAQKEFFRKTKTLDIDTQKEVYKNLLFIRLRLQYRAFKYEHQLSPRLGFTLTPQKETNKKTIKKLVIEWIERNLDRIANTQMCGKDQINPMYVLYNNLAQENNGEREFPGEKEKEKISNWTREVVLASNSRAETAKIFALWPVNLFNLLFEGTNIAQEEVWSRAFPGDKYDPEKIVAKYQQQFEEDKQSAPPTPVSNRLSHRIIAKGFLSPKTREDTERDSLSSNNRLSLYSNPETPTAPRTSQKL